MSESLAVMQTALRVLTAINERSEPEPADVDELRRLIPHAKSIPLDRLACDAIWMRLSRSAPARANAKWRNFEFVLRLRLAR